MNFASPSRMVYNVVIVGFVAGIIAFGKSPDGVSQPAEYLRWAVGLAEANPHFAVPAVGIGAVVILFGKSSDRGLRAGDRYRK